MEGSILLKDQIYRANTGYGIESVVFSDGETWNEAELWGAYLGLAAETDDSLKGTNGDDILNGGKGDDYLNGSYGADIYRYSAGAGNDVIDDDVNTDSIDQLVFSGAELTQENVIVSRVGTSNDLLVSFGSVEGSIF